jgi:putative DNA modification/repair radical SAM protein
MPRELADLTWQFYRRNYIEGLFLSSAVWKSPDYTSEQMLQVLEILRYEYRFGGYIHVKVIPGTDPILIDRLGMLADRISVNIELPSSGSLQKLAPDKSKDKILLPMGQIQNRILDNREGRGRFGGIQPAGSRRLLQKPWKKGTGTFAPAGQSTQMIVGASPETDRQILRLTESLYHRYRMKRVFYSAYIPVVEDSRLPSKDITPPLWREHRLYQADWLLRFYGFSASELLDEKNPQLHPYLDPKCHWAIRHPELFPMEVNRAAFDELVRVPGVGVESALRILRARKLCPLTWDGLKNIGVVLKRARYFLLCKGKPFPFLSRRKEDFLLAMMSPKERALFRKQECSWFQPSLFTESDLASGGDESTGLTAIVLPGLDDRQKEALQCISIPVFS